MDVIFDQENMAWNFFRFNYFWKALTEKNMVELIKKLIHNFRINANLSKYYPVRYNA